MEILAGMDTTQSEINLIVIKNKEMKIAPILLCHLLIGLNGDAQFECILKDFAVGFSNIKASEFAFLDEELDEVHILGHEAHT